MKNGKRRHAGGRANVMRAVFLAAVVLSVLSISVFSLQTMYSSNIGVEVAKGYGIYQNGIFQDTKDVLVPSVYAVQRATITVANNENRTRNISVSVDYGGNVELVDPMGRMNSSSITWDAQFFPYEARTFSVTGKDLEVGTPAVAEAMPSVPESVLPPPLNKTLVINNLSNQTNKAQSQTFSYTEADGLAGVLAPIVNEQKKLDLAAKSILVIFAGFVVLALASGFAFLFGSEEKPKVVRKAKIHIGDIYHNWDEKDVLTRYEYEENKYWKE